MPDRLRKDEDVVIRPELELRGEAGHGGLGESPGATGSTPVSPPVPTCPFARQGVDAPLMAACPGYRPEAVSFTGLGAGESLGVRVSCRHLGTQRGTRGFVTACRHPGGRPAEAARLAAAARRTRGLGVN